MTTLVLAYAVVFVGLALAIGGAFDGPWRSIARAATRQGIR